MANAPTVPATPLSPATNDNMNVQKQKYYVFNQTGNIMMSTTDTKDDTITQQVRDVFNEVSVFFAAMTKAITNTINPTTKQPYSIYNYNALSNIISGSGLFIHVTEEDVNVSSHSVGVNFSQDLLVALIGLASGTGELAFASAMVSSAGKEGITLSAKNNSSDSTVANIIFVCEYLMGMPVISAMVISCDASVVQNVVNVGPCGGVNTYSQSIAMHKDTYMFVTPTFIKQYSGDLDSAITSADYNEFVGYLEALTSGQAIILSISALGGGPVTSTNLLPTSTYVISGANFGNTTGTLAFGTANLNILSWTENSVTFMGMANNQTPPTSPTQITLTATNTQKTVVISAGAYTMSAAN